MTIVRANTPNSSRSLVRYACTARYTSRSSASTRSRCSPGRSRCSTGCRLVREENERAHDAQDDERELDPDVAADRVVADREHEAHGREHERRRAAERPLEQHRAGHRPARAGMAPRGLVDPRRISAERGRQHLARRRRRRTSSARASRAARGRRSRRAASASARRAARRRRPRSRTRPATSPRSRWREREPSRGG